MGILITNFRLRRFESFCVIADRIVKTAFHKRDSLRPVNELMINAVYSVRPIQFVQ
jgi:hypothetical protein